MGFIARSWLACLVIVTICGSPAMADVRRALGVVVQTDRGRIDSTNAVTGADIYSCDSLDTDDGGALRVQVGSSRDRGAREPAGAGMGETRFRHCRC
jgi:hypothetical protein